MSADPNSSSNGPSGQPQQPQQPQLPVDPAASAVPRKVRLSRSQNERPIRTTRRDTEGTADGE